MFRVFLLSTICQSLALAKVSDLYVWSTGDVSVYYDGRKVGDVYKPHPHVNQMPFNDEINVLSIEVKGALPSNVGLLASTTDGVLFTDNRWQCRSKFSSQEELKTWLSSSSSSSDHPSSADDQTGSDNNILSVFPMRMNPETINISSNARLIWSAGFTKLNLKMSTDKVEKVVSSGVVMEAVKNKKRSIRKRRGVLAVADENVLPVDVSCKIVIDKYPVLKRALYDPLKNKIFPGKMRLRIIAQGKIQAFQDGACFFTDKKDELKKVEKLAATVKKDEREKRDINLNSNINENQQPQQQPPQQQPQQPQQSQEQQQPHSSTSLPNINILDVDIDNRADVLSIFVDRRASDLRDLPAMPSSLSDTFFGLYVESEDGRISTLPSTMLPSAGDHKSEIDDDEDGSSSSAAAALSSEEKEKKKSEERKKRGVENTAATAAVETADGVASRWKCVDNVGATRGGAAEPWQTIHYYDKMWKDATLYKMEKINRAHPDNDVSARGLSTDNDVNNHHHRNHRGGAAVNNDDGVPNSFIWSGEHPWSKQMYCRYLIPHKLISLKTGQGQEEKEKSQLQIEKDDATVRHARDNQLPPASNADAAVSPSSESIVIKASGRLELLLDETTLAYSSMNSGKTSVGKYSFDVPYGDHCLSILVSQPQQQPQQQPATTNEEPVGELKFKVISSKGYFGTNDSLWWRCSTVKNNPNSQNASSTNVAATKDAAVDSHRQQQQQSAMKKNDHEDDDDDNGGEKFWIVLGGKKADDDDEKDDALYCTTCENVGPDAKRLTKADEMAKKRLIRMEKDQLEQLLNGSLLDQPVPTESVQDVNFIDDLKEGGIEQQQQQLQMMKRRLNKRSVAQSSEQQQQQQQQQEKDKEQGEEKRLNRRTRFVDQSDIMEVKNRVRGILRSMWYKEKIMTEEMFHLLGRLNIELDKMTETPPEPPHAAYDDTTDFDRLSRLPEFRERLEAASRHGHPHSTPPPLDEKFKDEDDYLMFLAENNPEKAMSKYMDSMKTDKAYPFPEEPAGTFPYKRGRGRGRNRDREEREF
ncbi:hypothetical protein HELRODRAFT_181763 [Helobdella robusta]|uniref:Uncharacterized protein n=1 Tax=Helobdella robusta TaxID=6412 RepID=T1FHA8_HELRO|nr:hypothetical protein HELRODRAFT_181763 [Helobdella robusta]ESN92143.1 hypothetical protein HELRODRAFT_181763 [Helobdella robusta]